MSNFRNVVFDVDGTLIDTEDAIVGGILAFARAHGVNDYDYDYIKKHCFGAVPQEAFARIGLGEFFAEGNSFVNHRMYVERRARLYEGTEQLLAQLRRRGVSLAVCTARPGFEFDVDPLFPRIAHYFDVVMSNEYADEPKPSPAPLQKYLAEFSLDPCEVLYVGDAETDESCAHGAGVAFALAGWGAADRSLRHEYLFERPEQLLSVCADERAGRLI